MRSPYSTHSVCVRNGDEFSSVEWINCYETQTPPIASPTTAVLEDDPEV